MTNGECMGPPPNVHGGCILALHSETCIAFMRLRAKGLGARSDERGILRKISVNYRKFTALWLTYVVRIRILVMERLQDGLRFELVSEMLDPGTGTLRSDASLEFVCSREGPHELLSLKGS